MIEVEHVKPHRTEKDKKKMSHFEKFVIARNEKADELAKEGAMWDGGFVAQARASATQQENNCTQFCSMQPAFTVWWTVKNLSRSPKKF